MKKSKRNRNKKRRNSDVEKFGLIPIQWGTSELEYVPVRTDLDGKLEYFLDDKGDPISLPIQYEGDEPFLDMNPLVSHEKVNDCKVLKRMFDWTDSRQQSKEIKITEGILELDHSLGITLEDMNSDGFIDV